jgi:sarcosine oxidase subunit gamma
VDISDRQVAIPLQGPGAALILNAVMPLDLHLDAFPVGMATRTVFERADVMLWRTGEQAFHIEVWRSFAPYVEGLIDLIARENAAA